jgi:putative protease
VKTRTRPEILAPAGDHDALQAALAAGADAVYLGLDDGFNARARAQNFGIDTLPALVAKCHEAGARLYLTLNTLVFEPELPVMEALLRKIAASGADALIVQDPAVCLLARELAPIELHASTQMTISSPEGALFAKGLGVTRVVLPRELSVAELETYQRLAPSLGVDDLETEVFVHGALCMSWSGQCLTSEAWGGRSANRGQCAQSCRLPYRLEVDGTSRALPRDDDHLRYLLSPKDLAGHRAVPSLVDLGVHTLKIEGRLKGPTYVQTAVRSFSRWLDHIMAGTHTEASAEADLASDLAAAHRVYSRGFTDGFLAGTDHQHLVDGRHPKHRGSFLGRVVSVHPQKGEVRVAPVADFPIFRPDAPPPPHTPPEAPLVPRRGMGVVFDAFDPENPREPGGPLFDVAPDGEGWRLTFGKPGPDLSLVRAGHRVWVNSDPSLEVETRKLLEAKVSGRVPLRVTVSGRLGEPLSATFSSGPHAVSGTTVSPLTTASGTGLDIAQLTDKLGAVGGTRFRLAALESALEPGLQGLFVPPGELKALRRELVAALEALLNAPPARTFPDAPVLPALRTRLRDAAARSLDFRAFTSLAQPTGEPEPIALCRLPQQLEAAIDVGLKRVELDWMEMVGLGQAVERAKSAGLEVIVATTRVQKPGEEGFDKRIAKLAPHGVLARHWGALMHFSRRTDDRPIVHGDFSLNVTNSLTALHLLGLGVDTLTASHDLDEAQLFALLAEVPAHLVTVVLHHHIPTFHTEHCVYAHTLSSGADYRTCGRPCERHAVSLVDPKGLAHPVITDVGCRNTVFEARAQSAASLAPRLLEAGVLRFRVELVRESYDETRTVLETYRALLRGELSPKEATRRVGVHEQFGVVRGVARSAEQVG